MHFGDEDLLAQYRRAPVAGKAIGWSAHARIGIDWRFMRFMPPDDPLLLPGGEGSASGGMPRQAHCER